MQSTIRFVLDNRIIEVDFAKFTELKPTTTVLNYLRSLPDHNGVKEGCAEGDCGACTVVIAEPGDGEKLTYRSVDSCLLFLPMIHGKQLITVENLADSRKDGRKLHPVQQQLIETNGSQCGYCTPGIAMSLFGIYKNTPNPSRNVVMDSLVGNLCRCTGYQPIVEAGLKACSDGRKDHFSNNEKVILQLLKEIKKDKTTIEISTSFQKYFKPFTLEEALRIRKENPEALIINGSTDVALRQTKKHEPLAAIIDLSGVEALSFYHENDESFIFGAGITLEQMKNATENLLPAFHKILSVFGSLQIRNLATLGGNICSASPIGDTLPVLLAYGAKVKLVSAKSERIIELEKFLTGYRKTDIRKDELLTEIMIPKYGPDTRVISYKVSRRKDLDISTVSAAFRVRLENDNVSEIVLAFGGMAAMTKRAVKAEEYLSGKKWSRENIYPAMKIITGEFQPISDARSEEGYRSKVAENLLLKFYLETTGKPNYLCN
jgi:xanthine dehydrogenase small subunit